MKSFVDRQARNRLSKWLKTSALRAQSTGAEPNTSVSDIHIHELSSNLHDRLSWVHGGLELLNIAVQSDVVSEGHYSVCLIFLLAPDAAIENIGVENPEAEWTKMIDDLTPPELSFARAKDWSYQERYLRDAGRVIGMLPIGGVPATVYLTERFDRYGEVVDAVRHIWVLPRWEE